MILEKRPRDYCFEMLFKMADKTNEERAHFLKTVVPEHLRAQTRLHYVILVEKAKWQKRSK